MLHGVVPQLMTILSGHLPVVNLFDKEVVRKEQPGYWDKQCEIDSEEGLATAKFRHTVMTKELLKIQAELPKHQGMSDGRVFFAGCWTNGANLHEECFEQAESVVKEMRKEKE